MESSFANKSQGIIGCPYPARDLLQREQKKVVKFFRNVNLIIGGSRIISSGRLGNSLITQFHICQLGKCLI